MVKILNYLWRFWLVVLAFLLTIILGLPVYLFSLNKKTYKYAYIFYPNLVLWSFLRNGNAITNSSISPIKKIDKNTQYVVISNHTSIMDIMLPCILFSQPPSLLCRQKRIGKNSDFRNYI